MSLQERPHPLKFFASQTGELLIGSQSVDDFIESGGNPSDIKPLREAMRDPQYDPVTRDMCTKKWTKQDAAAFLQFYAKVLVDGLNTSPTMPSVTQINIANVYGLSPSRRTIHNILGGITQRLDQTKLEPQNGRQRYLSMTRGDYLDVAREIYRQFGDFSKPVIDKVHELGLCPNYGAFEKRFRSASTVRELIGIGIDNRNWMVEDFIEWGVQVMKANDGWLPHIRTIAQYIDPNFRPGAKGITRRFGSVSKFRMLVEQAYKNSISQEERQRTTLLNEYDKYASHEPVIQEIPEEQKMRFVLVARLLSSLGIYDGLSIEDIKFSGEELLKMLRKKSGKGIAEIELIAEEEGAIELIYPQLTPDPSRYIIPKTVRRGSFNYKKA